MIKAILHYSTHSAKHKTFSKLMEFADERHLMNVINKANREGKKIIGHTLVDDKPCVWVLSDEFYDEGKPLHEIPNSFFHEFGKKYSIEEFEALFNTPPELSEFSQVTHYIRFQNIK